MIIFPRSTCFRPSLMMFSQYMLFAVWWVPLASYLTNMNVVGTQKALILSSMAIGCMASLMIGMIADRFFASEKVLATLNLLTAVLLLVAAVVSNPAVLFVTLLFAMLFHMPTWSLTSAIAISHAPSELFPRIRVFGSIGWVISGLCSLYTVNVLKLDFDGTNISFFYWAGIGLLIVVFNLSLPNALPPAKGQKGSVIDALGLRAVSLMKDRNFAVFILISFLAMIPFSMYWSYYSEFLLDQGFIFFVTFGVGLLVGNFISSQIIEHFSSKTNVVRTYDWKSISWLTTIMSFALLLVFAILFRNKNKIVLQGGDFCLLTEEGRIN